MCSYCSNACGCFFVIIMCSMLIMLLMGVEVFTFSTVLPEVNCNFSTLMVLTQISCNMNVVLSFCFVFFTDNSCFVKCLTVCSAVLDLLIYFGGSFPVVYFTTGDEIRRSFYQLQHASTFIQIY